MGHSPKVCNKHCPLKLNKILHRVLWKPCLNKGSSTIIPFGAKCGAIMVQNVGMHCNATSGFVMQTNPHLDTSEGLMLSFTICCEILLWNEMPRVGIEPTTSWLRVSCSTNWAIGAYSATTFLSLYPHAWQVLKIGKILLLTEITEITYVLSTKVRNFINPMIGN